MSPREEAWLPILGLALDSSLSDYQAHYSLHPRHHLVALARGSRHARIHLKAALAGLVVEAQLQVLGDQAKSIEWSVVVFDKLLAETMPVLDMIDLLGVITRPACVMVTKSRLVVSTKVSFQRLDHLDTRHTCSSVNSPPDTNESTSTSSGGRTVQSEQNHSMSGTSTTSWLMGG